MKKQPALKGKQTRIQRGGGHPPVLGNCRLNCARRHNEGVRRQNEGVRQKLLRPSANC